MPGDATKASCAVGFDSNGAFLPFVVTAGAGNDTVTNATGFDTQNGIHAALAMRAFGGDGDDVLSSTPDRISGDLLSGEAGNDTLNGGNGEDDLRGGLGNDTLNGQNGNRDELSGDAGDDKLFGGNGALDDLDGGPGRDLLDGGPGDKDGALYTSRSKTVTVDLAKTGPVQGEAGEGDTIVNVEDVIGGHANDTLLGNDADNTLVGAEGNDVMAGRLGKDALVGSEGNDLLDANEFDVASDADGKVDILVGLDGDDFCFLSTADKDFFDDTCEHVFG